MIQKRSVLGLETKRSGRRHVVIGVVDEGRAAGRETEAFDEQREDRGVRLHHTLAPGDDRVVEDVDEEREPPISWR